jgi:hypothetical protein
MTVRRNLDGLIVQVDQTTTVDEVVGERVLCPSCGVKVMQRWPLGWDGHSAYACRGVIGNTPEDRKAEFKTTYRHLFR